MDNFPTLPFFKTPFSSRRAACIFACCLAISWATIAPPTSAAPLAATPDDVVSQTDLSRWKDARVSLAVRDEPLSRLLGLFGQMTGARFRFATPLDAVVSPTLRDAPFWPAMTNLLHASGFRAQIAHHQTPTSNAPIAHVWIFRREESLSASVPDARIRPRRVANPLATLEESQVEINVAPTSTWQQWTRDTAPAGGWMSPFRLKRQKSRNRNEIVTRDEVGWKTLVPLLESSRRPGIGIRIAAAVPSAASKTTARVVRLRWPLRLREAPKGAQLLIETPVAATLWINGARVLHNWKGTRLIDVGQVLQPGANSLAIEWRGEPRDFGDASSPLLRYEWLFATS